MSSLQACQALDTYFTSGCQCARSRSPERFQLACTELLSVLILQKDAEDLRIQLQSVRAEMAIATQRAEAERSECRAKLHCMQSEADSMVCPPGRMLLRMLRI